tara:strand:+ start:6516 stop:7475 length:960 start_codon:yes stop_codon:yes gene_type:complete
MDYKEAGVDIEKGDTFVKNIAGMVRETHDENVKSGLGGYASLYQLGGYNIASSTDGVGTKLLLAKELEDFSGIGQDLVAMCANDLICVGARPLFFLDYYACGKLDLEASQMVLASIAGACKKSKMALVGGETAEMPDVYRDGDFDLAGFAVGVAEEKDLFDAKSFKEGDVIMAVESSGFHSNGYSLLRKTPELNRIEKQELLTPTHLYVDLMAKLQPEVKACAHITGGGLYNLARLSKEFDYELTNLPPLNEIAPIFAKILPRLDLPHEEAYKTFNMGMGLCLIVAEEKRKQVNKSLSSSGFKHWEIGRLKQGSGEVLF